MENLPVKKKFVTMWSIVVVLVWFQPCRADLIREETFRRLDKIRMEKKIQLFDYLDKIRKNAEAILSDSTMLAFYHLKNTYYQLQKNSRPPQEVKRAIAALKNDIREQYIRNYIAFYDILFVNRQGDIFYTIRQQADYHQNLFEGRLRETALARQLMANPRAEFVDYQFYEVSNEPSSFYVIPVFKANQLEGWFIFQLAINKINSIFAQGEQMGQTGEVFLVNKARFMLTDSRFDSESTILRRHLSHENILAKFREKEGHKIVVDYRGHRALSSFEVCRIEDSQWLLIAKIDEDEVVTEYFKKRGAELDKKLLDAIKAAAPPICGSETSDGGAILVDMDEYRKANKGERLRTCGVSSCTVLIVSYPGKFAYLSHISNLDKIYGGHTTDLVGNMLKQIKTFDIYPFEKRKLKLTIVANHVETFQRTLHLLIQDGFLLSQILFLHNGEAQYANPVHDYVEDATVVDWLMDRKRGTIMRSCSSGAKSVGEWVKPLLGYN